MNMAKRETSIPASDSPMSKVVTNSAHEDSEAKCIISDTPLSFKNNYKYSGNMISGGDGDVIMTAANTNIAHRTTSNLPTCRSSREVVTFRICSPTVGESASLNPLSGENTGLQAPRVGRLLIVKNKDVGVDSPPPVEGASNVVKAAAPPEPTSGSAALASCSVQKKPAFKVPVGKQQVPRARPAKPPFPRSTAISVNAQHLLKLSRIDKERKRLQSTPEYCDNTRVDNVGIPVIFGTGCQPPKPTAGVQRRSKRHGADSNSIPSYRNLAVRKELLLNLPDHEARIQGHDSPHIAFTSITLTTRSRSTPNGLNPEVIQEIIDVLDKASEDSSRLIVLAALTGYNGVWCGGIDTDYLVNQSVSKKSNETFDVQVVVELTDAIKALYLRITSLTKPLIALVNGECNGIGLSLALLADMIYATDKASFCTRTDLFFKSPSHGNFPEYLLGLTRTLPEAATEMLLSGCRMDSGMAEKYNLISRAPFHSNSIKNTILNTIHRLALNQSPSLERLSQTIKMSISSEQRQELFKVVEAECVDFGANLTPGWFREYRKILEDRKPKCPQ